MNIEITVEGKNAFLDVETSNYPFCFSFIDRTSKNIIKAYLDLDTFISLYGQIHTKVDTKKMLKDYKSKENKSKRGEK